MLHIVLLLVLVLETTICISDANWCICRSDMSDVVLQKTLDYACGAGADCTSILPNGACYQPNTVRSHCSYAVNSYFQRKGQVPGSCDFAGTATATVTDPSYSPCLYPSLASSPMLPGTTPVSTTPVISIIPPPSPPLLPPPPPPPQGFTLPPPFLTPTTTIPNIFPPPTTTTTTGGGLIGLGPPTGTGITSDGTGNSYGGFHLLKPKRLPLFLAIILYTGGLI